MGCFGSKPKLRVEYRGQTKTVHQTVCDVASLHSYVQTNFPDLMSHAFYFRDSEDTSQVVSSDTELKSLMHFKPFLKLQVEKVRPFEFPDPRWQALSNSVFKLRQKGHELAGTGFMVTQRIAITTTENFSGVSALKQYSALFQLDSVEVNFNSEVFIPFPDQDSIRFAVVELAPDSEQTEFLDSLTPIPLQSTLFAENKSLATVIYYTRNFPVLQAKTSEIHLFDHKFFAFEEALKEGSSGAPVLNSEAKLIGVFSSYKSDDMPGSVLNVEYIVEKLSNHQESTLETEPCHLAIERIWKSSSLESRQKFNFSESTCFLDTRNRNMVIFNASSCTASIVPDLPPFERGSSAVCTPKGILITGPNQHGSQKSATLFDGVAFVKVQNTAEKHSFHCSVHLEGKVYVISGKKTNAVEMFDLVEKTWKQAPPIPKKKFNFSGIVVSGSIFVLGGQEKTRVTHSVWKLENSEWTKLSFHLPFKLSNAGAILVEAHKLLIFGGVINQEDEQIDNEQVWELNLNSGKTNSVKGLKLNISFGSFQPVDKQNEAVIFSNSGQLLRYHYSEKNFYEVRFNHSVPPEPS